MKVLAWYIDLNGIENKNIVKYPYPTSIQKTWFLCYKTQMTFKSDNTNPTLVSTWIYISYTFKHTILLRQKMSYDPTNQLQNSEINVGNQYTASFGPNKMLWQNKELKKSCTTKLSVEYIQRVQLILRFCIKSSSIGVYRHTEISLDCWFNAMWTHDFDRNTTLTNHFNVPLKSQSSKLQYQHRFQIDSITSNSNLCLSKIGLQFLIFSFYIL